MPVYTISDPHLSFSADKSMVVFGSRWADYTRRLKENWNALITEEDHIIIGGDISWAMKLNEILEDFKFIESLPGKKYIMKGNHDFWWETATKIKRFFAENNILSVELLYNNAFLCENIIICGSRGWFDEEDMKYETKPTTGKNILAGGNIPAGGMQDNKKILARELTRLNLSVNEAKKLKEKNPAAEIVVFLHYPPIYGDYKCGEILAFLSSENISRCYFGHIHSAAPEKIIHRYKNTAFSLVSSDYLEFEPLKIN